MSLHELRVFAVGSTLTLWFALASCGLAQAGTLSPPVNLGALANSVSDDGQPIASNDGLRVYFTSDRTGGFGGRDIWMLERASASDPFGAAKNLGAIINQGDEDDPGTESADGLRLYYNRVDKFFVATRPSVSTPWDDPAVSISNTPFTNITGQDFKPAVSADELTLVFQLNFAAGDPGNSDLMLATRASTSDAFSVPTPLSNISVPSFREVHPSFSLDGLAIYFASNRPGGAGQYDLYRAMRANDAVPWTDASVIVERLSDPDINTKANELGPYLLGPELYFSSDRAGGFGSEDLYVAVPEPRTAALASAGVCALSLFFAGAKRRRLATKR